MSAPARTNGGQLVAALLVGASAGTVLVAGWLFVVALFTGPPEFAPVIALGGFFYAPFLWVGGLLLVGLPVGTVLHFFGARSRRIGALAGAVLSSLPLGAWIGAEPHKTAEETLRLIFMLVSQAAAGAVVGWIVVHVAYDRKGASQ
ncbi:hypothetical protein [Caulobacter endophyticus]|uniref:hypothetical protein n=1 Tax=Caulobacter endophyticus TaxID=2172652 RepID=UPI00240F2668|nr:hypothetical protein [Caulobacter endophyticus]MDG2529349.1 hypothetical protein [Caulobacter endophyticus]